MKKILLSLIPAGAMAGIVLSGLPANAATSGITCSGDVCAQVNQVSGQTATITAWAFDQCALGHFTITTHYGVYNSPDQMWNAGGPGYSFEVGVPSRENTPVTVTAVDTYQGGEDTICDDPGYGKPIGQVSFKVEGGA